MENNRITVFKGDLWKKILRVILDCLGGEKKIRKGDDPQRDGHSVMNHKQTDKRGQQIYRLTDSRNSALYI